jgi:hypothetical protein
MFVRDGDKIVPPNQLTPDDYLIVNVSYSAPFLRNPIRDSAHLDGLGMVEFSYPMAQDGTKGVAKFSAFGVIGGKLVRSTEQVINPDEEAVFILASKDGKIQLVSQSSVMPEDDALAQRLLEAGPHPRVTGHNAPVSGPESEGGKKSTNGKTKYNGATGGKEIAGKATAVEYTSDGRYLWVELDSGQQERVRLQESYPFESASSHVRVTYDEKGVYAKSIVVELKPY